jgi:hypothetical protein
MSIRLSRFFIGCMIKDLFVKFAETIVLHMRWLRKANTSIKHLTKKNLFLLTHEYFGLFIVVRLLYIDY